MSAYNKTGNRISLLPVAQYCGLAPVLSEQHGAGRAAAMSQAFHALCARAEDAKEKLARLTPKELAAIGTWKAPGEVKLPSGRVLKYDDAEREQPVGLTLSGEWADDGNVVTCGTLDFAWVADGVAYVADIKKSSWTVSGPDTLQLLTYGYAWAKKHGCSAFVTGLFIAETGEWVWDDSVRELDDFSSLDLWARIMYAATNRSDTGSPGDHCKNCYGRLYCPEWVLPAAAADTVLAPVAAGGLESLDPEKLSELVLYCQRVKGVIEKVEEQAKEMARRGTPVSDGKGKVWKATQCKGRESLNQTRLLLDHPEMAKYYERGQPYSQFRWSKA